MLHKELCTYIVAVFKRGPPSPPSIAQAVAASVSSTEDHTYIASLRRLFHNRAFMLLLITYGKLLFYRLNIATVFEIKRVSCLKFQSFRAYFQLNLQTALIAIA